MFNGRLLQVVFWEVSIVAILTCTGRVEFLSARNRLPSRELTVFMQDQNASEWLLEMQSNPNLDMAYWVDNGHVHLVICYEANVIVGLILQPNENLKTNLGQLLTAVVNRIKVQKYSRVLALSSKKTTPLLEFLGFQQLMHEVTTGRSVSVKTWGSSVYGPIGIDDYSLCMPTVGVVFVDLEQFKSYKTQWIKTLSHLRQERDFLHVIGIRGALDTHSLKMVTEQLKQQFVNMPNTFVHLSDLGLTTDRFRKQFIEESDEDAMRFCSVFNVKQWMSQLIVPLGAKCVYILSTPNSQQNEGQMEMYLKFWEFNQIKAIPIEV